PYGLDGDRRVGARARVHPRSESNELTTVGRVEEHSMESHHPHRSGHERDPSRADERAVDPVCGMKVDPTKTLHRAEHDGRTFYFCAARCREKFLASPGEYLRRSAPAKKPDEAIEYTCPMHPEVVQKGPGSCPIRG